MCAVTRTRQAPAALLRFVVGPDGAVVPDLRHKLPGRGVWVTATADTIAAAVKKKAFSRGFRREVSVSQTLISDVEGLLVKDCLQGLSLANKAGGVVTGFVKVEAAILDSSIVALIEAADASAEGNRKLKQALRRRFGSLSARPCVKLFTSEQLSLALGHTNVIHAALVDGPSSEVFLSRWRRLALYRPISSATEKEADMMTRAGLA